MVDVMVMVMVGAVVMAMVMVMVESDFGEVMAMEPLKLELTILPDFWQ